MCDHDQWSMINDRKIIKVYDYDTFIYTGKQWVYIIDFMQWLNIEFKSNMYSYVFVVISRWKMEVQFDALWSMTPRDSVYMTQWRRVWGWG
jgi:hypothetical protein